MDKNIPNREINKEEVQRLISTKPEDISLTLLKEFFAFTKNKKPLFNPNDTLTLPANTLENKEAIKTTVGRYIYNLFMLYPNLIKKIGYINVALDKKNLGNIDNKLAMLLLSDEITTVEYTEYIDKIQWLGFALNNIIVTTYNFDLLQPIPEAVKRKKELSKEHQEAINNGDIIATSKIEKEILSIAKEKVSNAHSYDFYNAGVVKGGVDNSYKNTTLMRGAIASVAEPGKFSVSTASLVEGIPKDEYHNYANLMVAATYGRAIMTREGGYEAKKFVYIILHLLYILKGIYSFYFN